MHLAPHPMEQKYLPNISPLLQAEHTCVATSDMLLLGKLKIYSTCAIFTSLLILPQKWTKASLLSCSLSTHETEMSISCFVVCSLLSHPSFPSSCFTRHRSVEAYYASGWNSRTWAVNENIIGVCEFNIFRESALAKNTCVCVCWFSKWKIHFNLAAVFWNSFLSGPCWTVQKFEIGIFFKRLGNTLQ